ncbi:MAG: tRNA pseudouridine(38-40) synthase TruA [Alphaproteobacteria bacterium]|nr:tRNA pseudouridine(38-40) synthase TruA [Alphaproteobacteria bacterium]
MTRWRIDLEYDGRGFVGWQVQPGARSIQGVLEDAVERLFGERVRVSGSGRTDAGVHAEQQVASFAVEKERSEKAVRDGLNAFLPPDVAVVAARRVPDDFDPRRAVKVKCYRYTWLDRPARSPLWEGFAWHLRDPLDVEAMDRAIQAVVGTHDFTSFRAVGCQAAHPVRTIEGASVTREGPVVRLRIRGNGFLRHMVRILAGTLTEVGQGRADADRMARALEGMDRSAAGRTAPPEGLALEWVDYGEGEGVGRA